MAGHRLLLVHLFLPDTLSFQDWSEEEQNTHYRIPSQQVGHEKIVPTTLDEAPSSPVPDSSNESLPVQELQSRLARASLTRDAEDTAALSDSETNEVYPTSRRIRSARSSFNEHNKKINMSLLMSEASQGSNASSTGASTGATTASNKLSLSPSLGGPVLSRSRRGSSTGSGSGGNNSSNRPVILTQSPTEDTTPLPIAAASDHGRSAAADLSPSLTASNLPSASSSLSPFGHKSRRGSMSTPSGSSFHASSALSMTSTQQLDSPNDGSGTRAPGARVSGKAGTMTPLSIIGDLAAKQSAIQPRQQATTGDSERHHPFGSGAVTPLRPGQQTVGPSRTPGIGPRPFLQTVLSKTPMSLSQAKMEQGQERGSKSQGEGSAAATKRPALPPGRHTASRVPLAAKESWAVNDNGREAAQSMPPPTVPAHSSSDGPDSSRSNSRHRQSPQVAAAATSKYNNTTAITPVSSVPASAWSRSGPKMRASSRASLGRRPSTINGTRMASMRRGSSASLEHMQEDSVAEEDEEGESMSASSVMPTYEFAPNPSSNGGLVNAVSSLTRDRLRSGKVYIGTPGISTRSWATKKDRESMTQRFYQEKNSLPVWVDDETFEGAYNHFCKQILWPTFHYTLPTQKGLDNEHESFINYHKVNRKFADTIIGEYKEGDIVWINDYHLLLVPQMVRESLPHATIGFFLHVAFPSSEIFRCLSVRVDILRGMLGSDLIGFQTHNFCRHFRQTVSRILQLEATPKGIQMDGPGGFVTVAPFPIGIDVRSLNRRRAEPDVSEWVDKLRARYEGKKVIVGRDKLDWIKGVRQKLLAFEIFLSEHQEWIGNVVLIQVALATTEENEEVAAATDVIARINNKYSTLTYQPVVFLHVQDITFSQYLALLTIADCCLNSSRREGMGLTPHEYVVCQEEKHRPLILSELSGTYSALQACIGINPWNTKQMSHAIFKALTMSDEEAFDRWKDLHRQVVTQTAQHWIQSLLGRLEKAHISREKKNNFFIPRLEIGQLVSEWRASKSRLLLFDLEDTLLEEEDVTEMGKGRKAQETIKMLCDLCGDARNRVYVLSGRGPDELDLLVARIPRIGLIAENGCAVMYAGEPEPEMGKSKEWTSLVAGTDLSWRAPVKEILSYFTERTPGSQLEDRGTSILWRFWTSSKDEKAQEADRGNRDFQWSRRQAAEVQNLIYDSLGERFRLRIIPGRTTFLIMPKNTSRANAVQHIVSLSHIGQLPSMLGSNSRGSGGSSFLTHGRSAHYSSLDRQQVEKVSTDGSTFKQPTNDWQRSNSNSSQLSRSGSMLSPASLASKKRYSSSGHAGDEDAAEYSHRPLGATNPYTLHPLGMGTFDFVLCIGQDDMLLSYINSLDLPFAPVTCTSVYHDEKGQCRDLHRNIPMSNHGGGSSEANYYLDGVADVHKNLNEILAFKGRDLKWGHASMDV